MTRKSKKVWKLRAYRDKLLVRITNLEGRVRDYQQIGKEICFALSKRDNLRIAALASQEPHELNLLTSFTEANEMAKELALTYRMLNVEREYTRQVSNAAGRRDYLRVAALCADHLAETIAHDKMLSKWSKDHGFTHSLRKEIENEMGT